MKNIKFWLFISIIAFIFSGCVFPTPKPANKSSSAPAKKTSESTAVYYDFEDVLIPSELSIVNDKTMVISTPDFASGVITLEGRIEKNSLFHFFTTNMMKDNWKIESSIKSPGVTILVFNKANRCAVITLQDSQFNNTIVQIGVAPLL